MWNCFWNWLVIGVVICVCWRVWSIIVLRWGFDWDWGIVVVWFWVGWNGNDSEWVDDGIFFVLCVWEGWVCWRWFIGDCGLFWGRRLVDWCCWNFLYLDVGLWIFCWDLFLDCWIILLSGRFDGGLWVLFYGGRVWWGLCWSVGKFWLFVYWVVWFWVCFGCILWGFLILFWLCWCLFLFCLDIWWG